MFQIKNAIILNKDTIIITQKLKHTWKENSNSCIKLDFTVRIITRTLDTEYTVSFTDPEAGRQYKTLISD